MRLEVVVAALDARILHAWLSEGMRLDVVVAALNARLFYARLSEGMRLDVVVAALYPRLFYARLVGLAFLISHNILLSLPISVYETVCR